MRWILLLFLSFTFFGLGRAGDDIWITRGLKARLIFTPITSADREGPSYRILLELHNVGVEGSQGLISREVEIAYDPDCLDLHVTDQNGQELAKSQIPVDGMWTPRWILVIPPDGILTFPIGSGGDTPSKMDQGKGRLLFLGVLNRWLIPQSDGKTYYLSGTLDAREPDRRRTPPADWPALPPKPGAKISLARIELPRN